MFSSFFLFGLNVFIEKLRFSIGGTVGALFTCPLELVKVRLQSSQGSKFSSVSESLNKGPTAGTPFSSPTFFRNLRNTPVNDPTVHAEKLKPPDGFDAPAKATLKSPHQPLRFTKHFHELDAPQFTRGNILFRSKIIRCMAEIIRTEGIGALFKGLLPTLVGVLPSR